MPDLGKYADTIALAYGLTIGLIVGLIVVSLWRGHKVHKQLREAEARRKEAAHDD